MCGATEHVNSSLWLASKGVINIPFIDIIDKAYGSEDIEVLIAMNKHF